MAMQKERTFGSFPRIEVRQTVYGRYEVVNVRTTKEGEKVPFLTGAGPGMARKVSFDNSALVDSVYDLAEMVSKTVSLEGPDILQSKPMLRDGIPEELLPTLRKNPGAYTPVEIESASRWKNASIQVEWHPEEMERMTRHPDATSPYDVTWDAIPKPVSESIRKWYAANGMLIPMERAVYIGDSGDAWTDETVTRIKKDGRVEIAGERRMGTPIAEIIRRLQLFYENEGTVRELVEFEKRQEGREPDMTQKWRLPQRNRFNRQFFEGMLMTGSRSYGGFGVGLEPGHWKNEGPGYYLYTESLLPGAYAQVVFSLMQGRKFCASPRCGRLFTPVHENQKFCPDCGEREKKRLAMQRYRAVKKEKQGQAGR